MGHLLVGEMTVYEAQLHLSKSLASSTSNQSILAALKQDRVDSTQ
jgi:hypothetical protein